MDKRKQTAARGRVGASSKRKQGKAVKAGGAGRTEKSAGRTRKAAAKGGTERRGLAWSEWLLIGILAAATLANLAYNVTVLMTRPEDRWHWVYNGIRLLRDRGIPLNPESATLKRELGWIFQHKIGTDSDASSAYFRTRWAQEMAPCLLPDGAAPEPGFFCPSFASRRTFTGS